MNDGHIVVSEIHTVEERRAPVDIFFRTLSESHRERAVSVVLSGTGADGSMGLKRVKENGGVVFVQNPREAEYNDMARNAIATNLVDAVLPVAEIPAKIIAYKQNRGAVTISVEAEEHPEEQQKALRDIFMQLRVSTRHDFANYKRPTILRRIERRINVRNLSGINEYAVFLREQPEEVQSLLKDLLISVTNFFRDKSAFAALEHDIIPRIVQDKTVGNQIRVWVAGCATGEEAYSIAMMIAERMPAGTDTPEVQIFATDIDEAAIATARDGFYTLNDAADVSPERLRRFFTKEREGYRIRREIREMVLFANHNVIKDPPFSRLDLATCRNMLIYLNHAAQKRVMETFHFALKPDGYLFLGGSESIDGSIDLFVPFSKEHNIFQSRNVESRIPRAVSNLPHGGATRVETGLVSDRPELTDTRTSGLEQVSSQRIQARERLSYADLHQQLLEQFAPPSVVVNEEYDIIHLSERAGRFMQIQGGEPSNNLLKVIRPELRLELRTALYQAVQKRSNVEAKNLTIKINERAETINLHARPVLRSEDTARGFILVLFEKTEDAPETQDAVLTLQEPVAQQLEEELVRVKVQLRSSIEQYETQAEELKASNEELQAMNEELRSSGEELETGKEELQSINEELTTVNQELKIKVEELSQSNSDFQNLMNSTDIGTIFLDRSFRVKMFTPPTRSIINLLPSDLDRPLTDITTHFVEGLHDDCELVLTSLQVVEREIETAENRWYLLRVLPYRTAQDQISGVVLTFLDITERKRREEEMSRLARQIEQQSRNFNTTLTSINDFAYIFDRDGRFLYANQPLLDLLEITSEEIVGKNFFDLNYPEDLAAKLQRQIQEVFDSKEIVRDETPFTSLAGEPGFYEYIFTPVFAADGTTVEAVAGSTRDVSERKQAEESLRFQARLLDTVEQAAIATDLDGTVIYWNQFAEKLYGWTAEEAVNRNIAELTTSEIMAEQAAGIMSQLRLGKSWAGEFTVRRRDGTTFPAQIIDSPIDDGQGNLVGIVGVSIDITERIQAEEALRESEERSRLLIEGAIDFAIFRITPDGLVASWNTGAEKVFGYAESEIVGQSGEILFTPEDRAKDVPRKELEIALREGRAEDERWHIRKDGSRFCASGVMMRLKIGAEGFVKIARDQTKKIEAEKALRDKEILQKLISAQEDERKRITRDLHDELGQKLTALRLKLENVRKLCEEEEICGKIDEIQLLARQVDADLDFLAWELHPAALDDFGLIAALGNYVNEWSRHSGVTIEFHTSGLKRRARLLPEVETNLYRITQEALNNTHKHAKAKRADVLLEKRDGSVILIIEDDGSGFKVKDKKNRSKGLGLIGMQERAALVGGTLEIESAPEKGTTIFARVPATFVKKEKEK